MAAASRRTVEPSPRDDEAFAVAAATPRPTRRVPRRSPRPPFGAQAASSRLPRRTRRSPPRRGRPGLGDLGGVGRGDAAPRRGRRRRAGPRRTAASSSRRRGVRRRGPPRPQGRAPRRTSRDRDPRRAPRRPGARPGRRAGRRPRFPSPGSPRAPSSRRLQHRRQRVAHPTVPANVVDAEHAAPERDAERGGGERRVVARVDRRAPSALAEEALVRRRQQEGEPERRRARRRRAGARATARASCRGRARRRRARRSARSPAAAAGARARRGNARAPSRRRRRRRGRGPGRAARSRMCVATTEAPAAAATGRYPGSWNPEMSLPSDRARREARRRDRRAPGVDRDRRRRSARAAPRRRARRGRAPRARSTSAPGPALHPADVEEVRPVGDEPLGAGESASRSKVAAGAKNESVVRLSTPITSARVVTSKRASPSATRDRCRRVGTGARPGDLRRSEQPRRERAPVASRARVLRPERVEEVDQLLARRVVVAARARAGRRAARRCPRRGRPRPATSRAFAARWPTSPTSGNAASTLSASSARSWSTQLGRERDRDVLAAGLELARAANSETTSPLLEQLVGLGRLRQQRLDEGPRPRPRGARR